jgi:hypothetical protein
MKLFTPATAAFYVMWSVLFVGACAILLCGGKQVARIMVVTSDLLVEDCVILPCHG